MNHIPFSITDIADYVSAALRFLGVSVLVIAVAWALFRSAGCRWPKGAPIEPPEKNDVDGNQQSTQLKSRYARRQRLRGNLVCILPVMLGVFATNLIYFYYTSLDSSWYRIVLGAYLAVFDFIAIRFLRTLWESANE